MNHRQFFVSLLVVVLVMFMVGCGGPKYRPDSPDVRYQSSKESERLKLPPDVTGTGEQQFVIPRTGSKISRGSILPGAESARFHREGQLSWLELNISAEALWPEILAFLDDEGLVLSENNSVTGTLITEWEQPKSRTARDGILQSILGDKQQVIDDQILRYSLRIERGDGENSRLFVQTNQYRKHDGKNPDQKKGWALTDDDPAKSADLLTRILVWIGLDEQKSREILTDLEISEYNHRILLTSNEENRNYLLLWNDYETTFELVREATGSAGFDITDKDLDTGVIELRGKTDYLADISQAQKKRKEEKAGFFKRTFGSSKDKGADLTLRLQRLESRVFALDVFETDTGAIESAAGRQVLESIRNAIIDG